MYIRRLTCALTATLFLVLLGPAFAVADEPNADLDHDKVMDNLESHLATLPADAPVKLIVSLDATATNGRVQQLERAVGHLDVTQRFSVVDAVALTATKDQVRELADQHVVDLVAQDLPVHASDDGQLFHSLNDSAQASFGVTEAQLDSPLLDGNADGDPSTYSKDDMVAAVLDTGIDGSHTDLDGGKVLEFVDCTTASSTCTSTTPFDNNGHGTHVSATIAGTGAGDSRYRGVAPGAALVGVKVLDANGDGFTADVVKGIQWVIQHKGDYGIEAMNLSLGTAGCGNGTSADAQAVNEAWADPTRIAVMVAAGNDGPDNCTIGSPGDAKDSVTVGAMADLGALGFKQADFSSRGPTADGRIKPDISAPGVGITSASAGTVNGYQAMNGTSMATPFVTGVALLMMDANSSMDNDTIKDAIKSTAVDWGRGGTNTVSGSSGPDDDYGAGRLDAYEALAAADPTLLTSPPTEPRHTLRQGSLSGAGQVIEYTVDVADTNFPVAATLIDVPTTCRSGDDPDFDMKLLAPNGATVATATSSQRQDELGYAPTVTGVYRLRVYSFRDCGDFFVDVSGGSVSPAGTSNPDAPKPPETGPTPTTPVTTPTPVATAALVDAARVTARRATARLRKLGLRLLLRRGKLTFTGASAAAGRVDVAVRMKVKGKQVIVARATRGVSRAGQPRLTVRLTRAGRRLLQHRKSARLTVRAAVSDATRRRTAGTVLRVGR